MPFVPKTRTSIEERNATERRTLIEYLRCDFPDHLPDSHAEAENWWAVWRQASAAADLFYDCFCEAQGCANLSNSQRFKAERKQQEAVANKCLAEYFSEIDRVADYTNETEMTFEEAIHLHHILAKQECSPLLMANQIATLAAISVRLALKLFGEDYPPEDQFTLAVGVMRAAGQAATEKLRGAQSKRGSMGSTAKATIREPLKEEFLRLYKEERPKHKSKTKAIEAISDRVVDFAKTITGLHKGIHISRDDLIKRKGYEWTKGLE